MAFFQRKILRYGKMLLYLQRQVRTQMSRQSRKKSSTGQTKSAHRNPPHECTGLDEIYEMK